MDYLSGSDSPATVDTSGLSLSPLWRALTPSSRFPISFWFVLCFAPLMGIYLLLSAWLLHLFFFCQSRNLFMFLRVWLNCDSVILILVVWLLKFCIILCFLMVILIAMLHRHACAFYCNCCSAIYVFKYFVPIPEFYWTLIGCLTRN